MMPDVTRLDTLRARRPLIHCISNLVTANDCANLLLAAGASPIMAQALPEAEEITAASAASVLNTGTPDDEKFRLCPGLRTRRLRPGAPHGAGPGGNRGQPAGACRASRGCSISSPRPFCG